jgi:membrane-associated phospholipid phosphatase
MRPTWWARREISRAELALVLRLTAVALVGASLFLVVYMLAVRTARGQTLGNAALAGQRLVLARGAERILESLGVGSLAAGTLILMAVALIRRRPRLALVTTLTVVGSLLVSELMKQVILERPDLVGSPSYHRHNSFPSGHATAAAAIGAGLVMVAPRGARGKVGILGAVYAAAVAYSTLFSGWHRPSDVAGSAAIVLAVSAAAAAMLVWWRGSHRTHEIEAQLGSPVAAVALTSAGLALILAGFLGLAGPLEALESGFPLGEPLEDSSFIAMSTMGVGVSFLSTGFLVLGLHGVEFDPPNSQSLAAEE